MKKIKALLLTVFLSASCLLLIPSGKAQASSADILKKWTRINTYECIVDGKLLYSPISTQHHGTETVLDLITSYSTLRVLTPSYNFGGTTSGASVPCRYVIDGKSSKYNGMTNLLTYGGKGSLSGIKWSSSPSRVEQLFTALDYVGVESGGGGRFSIKASRSTETCVTIGSSRKCSSTPDDDVEVSTVNITVTRNENGNLYYERDSGNFWNDLKVSFNNGNLILELDDGSNILNTAVGIGFCSGGGRLVEPLQNNLNTMYDNLSQSLTNVTWQTTCTRPSHGGIISAGVTSTTYNYTFGVSDKVVDSSEMSEYKITDELTTAADKVNQNLTSSAYRKFTNAELYELYDYYLDKAIIAGGATANLKTCNPTSTDNLKPVKLLDMSDGTFKTCYVNLGGLDADNTKVNVPNTNFTKIIEISISDVIDRLDHLNTNSIDISAITGVEPSDDPYAPLPSDDSNGSSDPDVCGDGVGSLGWILCPVVNLLSETVQNFYNDYLQQNFLEVNSTWLGNSTDLYKNGWAKFRNYANILLVIVLLIVIFSQLTGIGITNYGIKKSLPRIILMAVLINISFFICQLAVDVSNISGYAINKLLTDMRVSFGGSSAAAGGGAGWLNALSIAGIGLTALTVSQWITPLLLALITSLISVAFAGIILGVRQAGILILVAISPLAFACYAFDGTKTWFDKWRKLFVSLLVVFPVCGLLMGGGAYASNLLASAPGAGIFIKLVAAMLKVIPFFFIPAMVKGSLAVVGNIGAKIGMIGRGLRGSATKMGRTSDLYQRADTGAGALGGKALRGIKGIIGSGVRRIPGGKEFAEENGFGKFLGRIGNRRIARSAQREYKLASEDAAANAIARSGFLDSDRREAMEADAERKLEDKGIEEQQSLLRTQLGDAGVSSDTTLKREIEKIQTEFNKKPQNVTLEHKLKAATKYLLDFDNGRGELVKQFHNLITKNPDSASTQAMESFLNRAQNMGIIKQSGQRGLQQMLQDRSEGNPTKSLAQYAMAKADKPDPNTVGKIDTTFLKAQLNMLKEENYNALSANEKADVAKGAADWINLYQRAANDQHAKSNISMENKNLMDQITHEAMERGISVAIPK